MTRDELLKELTDIEEKVEQMEHVLKRRVKSTKEARYANLWSKKEAVINRLNLLEEGAEFLLAASSSYKMVQSFKVSCKPV
ncbi:hypothetical protein JOC78_000894 [Bacillus ectoiniformans]|uniref:hypothetical protein n=1 Tax=Bacillus ectoiniformans TaxID=1494429 RepID=UPI00195D32A8|nr:hypothetical protein [Bacillus ectoiniformans]MBM7647954.1 hypothetical protein [Bacillus ectoiniformans]